MSVRPPAILISGPPASGKSTLAAAVARELGAALLDQDAMTGPMVAVVAELVGTEDLDDPRLAGPTRDARYECLVNVAADCLSSGLPVVLVAPFTAERHDPERWSRVAQRLQEAGGMPLLVWLKLSADELAQRMLRRAARRDAAKGGRGIWLSEPRLLASPEVPHLAIHANTAVAEQVRRLRSALV